MNMKWFAILGLLLFFGVAVAPNITADVKEQDVEEVVIDEINDWEQRLIGLVEEIISSYERTYGSIISPDEDCGCENEDTSGWNFPVLCLILYPIYCFLWVIVAICILQFNYFPYFLGFLGTVIAIIASTINCFWWHY